MTGLPSHLYTYYGHLPPYCFTSPHPTKHPASLPCPVRRPPRQIPHLGPPSAAVQEGGGGKQAPQQTRWHHRIPSCCCFDTARRRTGLGYRRGWAGVRLAGAIGRATSSSPPLPPYSRRHGAGQRHGPTSLTPSHRPNYRRLPWMVDSSPSAGYYLLVSSMGCSAHLGKEAI